jgi:hypothetical protein
MISGHFATALVAKTHAEKGSIWLYLIAAQSLDILMLSFVIVGIEHIDLGSSILPAMGSAIVDMRYSHDLVPVAGWTLVMALIAYVLTRSWVITAWCAALTVIHELCDLVTGHPHNVSGPETTEVGLKLWVIAPVFATFIEAGFGIACVSWYLRHHSLDKSNQWALYIAMGATSFLLLPLVIR